MSFELLQPIDAGRPFEDGGSQNDYACFYHLRDCKGVYVIVKNDDTVLYVGESHTESWGLKKRISQNYTRRNAGGTFRKNYCKENCLNIACGEDRKACHDENRRSFRRFKELLKSSKIYVFVAGCHDDEDVIKALEYSLICQLKPTYNKEIQRKRIVGTEYICEEAERMRCHMHNRHS